MGVGKCLAKYVHKNRSKVSEKVKYIVENIDRHIKYEMLQPQPKLIILFLLKKIYFTVESKRVSEKTFLLSDKMKNKLHNLKVWLVFYHHSDEEETISSCFQKFLRDFALGLCSRKRNPIPLEKERFIKYLQISNVAMKSDSEKIVIDTWAIIRI